MKAAGTFTVNKWDEETYKDVSSDMKMTQATVEYAFEGEADGIASVDYLMFYTYFDPNDQHKSSAVFVGLLMFSGKLSGKEGSFAMQENGVFENGAVNSTFRIIDGSGMGELKQISGTGQYNANQDGSHFEFNYKFL